MAHPVMQWREFQALQRVAEVDGRFVSYVEQGAGEPVILIHGIPTWGYLWHGVLHALPQQYRLLAPDLIGFGYSDKGDRFDRSIQAQAAVLERWMDVLRIERATVIAHDIGGGVALRLAALRPGRVSKLCLLNTVCYDSWPIEAMLQLGHPEARRKLSASSMLTLLGQALKQGFAVSPKQELLEGILAPYSTEVGKLSLIRNAAGLNTNLTTEITPLLPSLAMPTLILWGEDDVFQSVRFGERLARDIPNAQLVRIKAARHFVMWDQPEKVTRHLTSFLTKRETVAASQRQEWVKLLNESGRSRVMNGLTRNERVTQSEAIYAGVIAGMIAGIAMAMVSMMMAMMTGEGFWAPVKKISVTLLGASAAQEPGFKFVPVMVGMMIHFATAIAFGIIFAMFGARRSYGSAVALGIGYGLAVWLVMQFIVLPFVNPAMADMPPLQFAMLHMIFGGTLGSYPAFLPSVGEAEVRRMQPPRAA